MDEQTFIKELKKRDIHLNDDQMNQFQLYYDLLIDWNKKMNLTTIVEKEEVYLKHFFDSISLSFFFDLHQVQTVCDVGAGAGFPSIPLKIAFPNLQVTIVDSLNKRIQFLHELASALSLDNVHFYHDRAETFGQNIENRESFDVVTARAVAKMSVLSEFCLPLVKVGGVFIALKGANGQEELNQAKKAITTLGGQLNHVYSFSLPIEESERTIIVIDKIKNTPKKYPRKPGVPTKKPL